MTLIYVFSHLFVGIVSNYVAGSKMCGVKNQNPLKQNGTYTKKSRGDTLIIGVGDRAYKV